MPGPAFRTVSAGKGMNKKSLTVWLPLTPRGAPVKPTYAALIPSSVGKLPMTRLVLNAKAPLTRLVRRLGGLVNCYYREAG